MSKPNTKIYQTGQLEAVQDVNNQEVRDREAQRLQVAKQLSEQDKIEVIGAPMYRAYFGNAMLISINGIPIYVPLDGKRYAIPRSYAEIFNARINSVNEDMELEKKRSDVQSNFESYPGQLDLVRPV